MDEKDLLPSSPAQLTPAPEESSTLARDDPPSADVSHTEEEARQDNINEEDERTVSGVIKQEPMDDQWDLSQPIRVADIATLERFNSHCRLRSHNVLNKIIENIRMIQGQVEARTQLESEQKDHQAAATEGQAEPSIKTEEDHYQLSSVKEETPDDTTDTFNIA